MATKNKKEEPEGADQEDIEIEDIFDEDHISEGGNFFKFKKIGDRIAGEIMETEDKEAQGVFGAQRVFTLKTKDGAYWKVGIAAKKKYVLDRANRAEMGDILGFEYKEDYQTKENKAAGLAPSKSIEVYLQKKAKDFDDF